ncbi:MAG: family 43 glycosylhydrolase [Clostridia bacterium]|nr:family 43 glycosylhydrolase [Clostridia bacterium]
MNTNRTLEDAIYIENVSEIKRILERNPNLIDDVDSSGIAMPFLAAKTGNIDIIKYIVEYSRASMNIYDNNHNGMLHYAAMSGNVNSCRYLVERVGLSPTEGNNNLLTPYEIAHQNRFFELEQYFKSVVGADLKDCYHNPVRTGFFPDPSVVRVGEDYYMVNSSFIYYPCIPVSHSKDLIHWKIIGYAITNPDWANIDELSGGRGYWAPDISYYQGRFYITATYRMNDAGTVYRKQIVVSSEHPEGPYSKPAIIDEDGIDPSIFNDDDGKRYMLLNRGARIFELSSDATRQISKATMLYYGDNKRAPEGPHLLKKDGYYYLFEAEGGTGPGHRITVSRSRELMGIYEPCPYNPIMRQNDESAIIQRCGHGKPVQTQNGQWYMVYLCGRKIGAGYSILGRETALDPITWTADGWPIVNNLDGPSALQIKPDLPQDAESAEDEYNDDFRNSYLGCDWCFPRVPEMDGIVLANSYVKIKGSRYDLNSIYAKNVLLRRQQHFRFNVEAKMRMPALEPGQDCGLTCYYDENTFLKFGVFRPLDGDNMVVRVVEVIGDEVITHEEINVNAKERHIFFRIETNYLTRVFLYGYDEKNYEKLTVLNNVYYLCDEGLSAGKRFTGAMVGMYAHAGNTTSDRGGYGYAGRADLPMYVEFDYFNYEPVD